LIRRSRQKSNIAAAASQIQPAVANIAYMNFIVGYLLFVIR
jgi:hypothetical protein